MSDLMDAGGVIYRWHQIMFRLDEMDEMMVIGLTEDEVDAIDAERRSLAEELRRLEAQLGGASVDQLRNAHEHDRAYARQKRQMDEEASS